MNISTPVSNKLGIGILHFALLSLVAEMVLFGQPEASVIQEAQKIPLKMLANGESYNYACEVTMQ